MLPLESYTDRLILIHVRNFLENISTILANLKAINRTVYIMGDFNLNLINISENNTYI